MNYEFKGHLLTVRDRVVDVFPEVQFVGPVQATAPSWVTDPTTFGEIAQIDPGEVFGVGTTPAVVWYYIDGSANRVEFPANGLDSLEAIVPQGANGFKVYADIVWETAEQTLTSTLESAATISGPTATFPLLIADGRWDAFEVLAGTEGRRTGEADADIADDYDSDDYELRYYSGPFNRPDLNDSGSGDILTVGVSAGFAPGDDYTTSGSLAVGTTCHNSLAWKRLSDGVYQYANVNDIVFTIQGYVTPPPGTGDPAPVQVRSSISIYGITLNLQTGRKTGQYATGDWFIVSDTGSVVVTSITPQSTVVSGETLHGTMVGPGEGVFDEGRGFNQGWDSRDAGKPQNTIGYIGGLNLDPGKTGQNIVISQGGSASIVKAVGRPFVGNKRQVIQDMAVFTVVPTVPPANALRPAPHAVSKASPYVLTGVDISMLRSLSAPNGTPNYAQVLATVNRNHEHYNLDGTKQSTYPVNHMVNPGRDYATATADLFLTMHTNALTQAQKRTLADFACQQASDVLARAQLDGCWMDDGQLNPGRMLWILMGSFFLNDATLKSYANGSNESLWRRGYKNRQGYDYNYISRIGPIFQEWRQCFYVPQELIDRPPTIGVNNNTVTPYPQSALGRPEWGVEATTSPDRNNYGINSSYRPQNSGYHMGTAMVVHLTPGATARMNYNATLDYVDSRRNWMLDKNSPPNSPSNFHKNMYRNYRSLGQRAVWPADPRFPD